MNHTGHAPNHESSSHQAHSEHHHAVAQTIETFTVDQIKAQTDTTLPKSAPRMELKLVLGGDMERYVWHINGKALHEDRTISINEGDVIRFVFENETMMHHPMHLHGHFFRVLNGNGAYSPLKHTVDVGPHQTRTIEFYANEPGEWMLHCHNLYHMKTGMGRFLKYKSYQPKPEIQNHQAHDPHLHDHLYAYGAVDAFSNNAQAYFRMSQTWDELEARVEAGQEHGWQAEADLFFRRWLNSQTNIIMGGTFFEKEIRANLGLGYTLPLLIEATLLLDQEGEARVDLSKRFQWTSHFLSDVEFRFRTHGTDFQSTLMYSPSWSWAAGLKVTSQTLGVGARLQF